MRAGGLIIVLCFFVGGCASPSREEQAEARGYERGYRQSVKETYWLLQNQQRPPTAADPKPRNP